MTYDPLVLPVVESREDWTNRQQTQENVTSQFGHRRSPPIVDLTNPHRVQAERPKRIQPFSEQHSDSISIKDRQPLAQSSRRYSTGVVLSSGSPLISPGSDTVDQGVQIMDWKSAGVQTDESAGSGSENSHKKHGVHVEEKDENVLGPHKSSRDHRRVSRGVETVADRLMRLAGNTSTFDQHEDDDWMEITVHYARNLPWVKSPDG